MPTPKQLEVLRFVAAYTDEHHYPPTVSEIAESLGVSRTAINDRIGFTIAKGYAGRKPGIARGIWVTDRGRDVIGSG